MPLNEYLGVNDDAPTPENPRPQTPSLLLEGSEKVEVSSINGEIFDDRQQSHKTFNEINFS